eukprot:13974956-Alexandrium_andersonii.AAC.1
MPRQSTLASRTPRCSLRRGGQQAAAAAIENPWSGPSGRLPSERGRSASNGEGARLDAHRRTLGGL